MKTTVDIQYEKTWKMLQQMMLEHDKRMLDHDKRMLDHDKRMLDHDKRHDKNIEEINKLKMEIDRIVQERVHQSKERALRSKELDRQFKETDRKIDRVTELADKYIGKVNEFDRNWGKLVESLVAPGIVDQFKKINMDIDGMTQRVLKRKHGKSLEVDILLTNSELIIPVEVKTTLNVEAVNEHIEKHLIPFKTFFPEYKNKSIYGAVAYIHIEENADRYAYKKGLFVLTFGDNDMVVIKNDANFKPVTW